jgi:hypothetical protein
MNLAGRSATHLGPSHIRRTASDALIERPSCARLRGSCDLGSPFAAVQMIGPAESANEIDVTVLRLSAAPRIMRTD